MFKNNYFALQLQVCATWSLQWQVLLSQGHLLAAVVAKESEDMRRQTVNRLERNMIDLHENDDKKYFT